MIILNIVGDKTKLIINSIKKLTVKTPLIKLIKLPYTGIKNNTTPKINIPVLTIVNTKAAIKTAT